MIVELREFTDRFPEFEPISQQHEAHVRTCLKEAARTFEDLDLVLLKAAALIAESPIGRSAGLVSDKSTATLTVSVYSKRLDDILYQNSLGERCL